MPYDARQQNFINTVKTLPVYNGWSDDEISSNINDVLNSGDQQRISTMSHTFGSLGAYSGWDMFDVESNVKDVWKTPTKQTTLQVPRETPVESPIESPPQIEAPQFETMPSSTLDVEQPKAEPLPRITDTPEAQQQVAEEMFGGEPEEPEDVPEQERNLLQNVVESFKRGNIQNVLDYMSYEAMTGKRGWKEVEKLKKEFDKKQQVDPVEANNWLTKSIMGVSGMLPTILKGVIKGQEGMAGGAVGGAAVAAIGGQLGPQALAPEELLTVPSGALVGGTVGGTMASTEYFRKIGAGSMFSGLKEKGVTDKTAQTLANIASVPYALIEQSQVSKAIPGADKALKKIISDSILKTVSKFAAKKAIEIGEESLEEGLQGAVDQATQETGQYVDGQLKREDLGESAKRVLSRFASDFVESIGQMTLLMGPKIARGATETAIGIKKDKGKVKESPEAVEKRIEAVKEKMMKAGVEEEITPSRIKEVEKPEGKTEKVLLESEKALEEYEQKTRPKIKGNQDKFNNLMNKIGVNSQKEFDALVEDKEIFEKSTIVLNDKEFDELENMIDNGMKYRTISEKPIIKKEEKIPEGIEIVKAEKYKPTEEELKELEPPKELEKKEEKISPEEIEVIKFERPQPTEEQLEELKKEFPLPKKEGLKQDEKVESTRDQPKVKTETDTGLKRRKGKRDVWQKEKIVEEEKALPTPEEIEKKQESPKPKLAKQLGPLEFEKSLSEVEKQVPKELWKKVRFDYAEMEGKTQGSMRSEGKYLIVTLNSKMPIERAVPVIFHEVMGHAGATNVLNSNPKIYKRLNALYNTPRQQLKKGQIQKYYKEDFEKLPDADKEEALFSEWIAHNIEEHLSNPKKRGTAYKVVQAVKQFLVDMGWKVDDVEVAMESVVKEIRKTSKFEAEIDVKAAKGVAKAAKELPKIDERQLTSEGVPQETIFDKARQKVQDKFHRLKRIQTALTPNIKEELDTYLAQELYHDKVKDKLDKLDRLLFKPLRQKLVKSRMDLGELEDYLYAKHAPERNKTIRERRIKHTGEALDDTELEILNKADELGGQKANLQESLKTQQLTKKQKSDINIKINNKDKQLDNINKELEKLGITKEKLMPIAESGSGMTNEEASDIIKTAEEEGKTEKLDELAKIVYDINKRVQNVLIEGSLEKKETIEDWKKWKNYITLQGIDEEDAKPRIGKGFSIKGKEYQMALGRKSKARNILSNTIMNANKAIMRAEKNKVGQTFLNYVRENPNKDLWEIDKVEYKPSFDKKKGEVVMRPDPRYKLADNVMSVKENGKEYHITIHDPSLARGMVNLGVEKSNKLLNTLGYMNRYLSMVNTSLVPEFVISNLARDLQTAIINVGGEYDAKAAGKIVKNIPKAMKGVWQGEKGKSGEWANYYKEFRAAGGKVGFFGLETVDDIQKKLVREISLLKPGKINKTIKMATATKNFIMDINAAVESSTRLATYVAMREKGMSKSKSASVAKNVTVNFNRKGELGTMFNSLYVFSNAGIQGTARLLQALKNPRVLKMAAGIIAGSIALAQLNRFLAGQDDDDENYYDKIPNWIKENNLIIMKPGTKGEHFKIPVPYGYNVFHAFGQALDKSIHNPSKKGVLESAGMVTGAIANAFNPLGSASTALQTITPTAGRWITDLYLNKNFFGAPIMKEEKYGVPKAKAHAYFKSTSEQSKWVAQSLNDLTGGTKYQPGMIDISPDLMDYVTEYFTGGAGRTLNQAISGVAKIGSKKEVPIRSIPVVRRFMGEIPEYQDIQTFYDRAEKLDKIKADYDHLKKTNPIKADEFRNKNREALKYSIKVKIGGRGRETSKLNRFEKSIRELRKVKKKAEERKREDLVKKYDKMILDKVKRFNWEYKQKVGD